RVAMPVSTLPPAGLGAVTFCQLVPFQCAISVPGRASGPKQWPVQPTTQALPGEVAATPVRAPVAAPAGLAACFQAWPFQCRMTVCGLAELMKQSAVQPTAQALLADAAATADSEVPAAGFGLATRFHEAPFQCRISVCGAWPKPW